MGISVRTVTLVLTVLVFGVSGRAAASNTYWAVQSECSGANWDCFATNTTPTPGKGNDFGNASVYDNVSSLPTYDAASGNSYGSSNLLQNWPAQTGGDYGVGFGGNPQLTINTTDNYWQFDVQDCSVSHCEAAKSVAPFNSSSSFNQGSTDAYFPWNNYGYNDNNQETVTYGAYQDVMSWAGGPFHGFLCLNLHNYEASVPPYDGEDLEYCRETWRSDGGSDTGYTECGDIGGVIWANSSWATLQPASDEESYKGWVAYNMTISRQQFTAAVDNLNNTQNCDYKFSDNPDNYVVTSTQNGYESGPNGGGSGSNITFQTGDDELFTTY